MPPAVAQAPMVTRVRVLPPQLHDPLEVRRLGDRALHEQDVVGAGRAGRGRLREVDDLEVLDDREELVLEVQERQLAAVARGELDHADAGASAHGGMRCHQMPSRPKMSPSCPIEKTGPSRHTKYLPIWQ